MTLKKREKILAIAIAVLAVVFALYLVWPSGGDSIDILRNKRDALEKEKDDNLKKAILLKKDTDRLPALLRRALPSNPEAAKREYQNWLRKQADDTLKNVNLVAADQHAPAIVQIEDDVIVLGERLVLSHHV